MFHVGVYVTTHSGFKVPQTTLYLPMQEGSALSNQELGFMRDDLGDNISLKNRNYKKLTALYWIWKNDTVHDVIGIVHHKRFFKNEERGVLTRDEIEEILTDHDFIVPPMRTLEGETVEEQYISDYAAEDLEILRHAIAMETPEYLTDFDEVMKGNVYCTDNQLLGKAELVKEYCAWLFPVLFMWEDLCKEQENDPTRLLPVGVLSQRLLLVYAKHQKLRMKEIRIGVPEEKIKVREAISDVSDLISFGNYGSAGRAILGLKKTSPSFFTEEEDLFGYLRAFDRINEIHELEFQHNVSSNLWEMYDSRKVVERFYHMKELLYSIPVGNHCFQEIFQTGYSVYAIMAVLDENELSKDQQKEIYEYLAGAFSAKKMEEEAGILRDKIKEKKSPKKSQKKH